MAADSASSLCRWPLFTASCVYVSPRFARSFLPPSHLREAHSLSNIALTSTSACSGRSSTAYGQRERYGEIKRKRERQRAGARERESNLDNSVRDGTGRRTRLRAEVLKSIMASTGNRLSHSRNRTSSRCIDFPWTLLRAARPDSLRVILVSPRGVHGLFSKGSLRNRPSKSTGALSAKCTSNAHRISILDGVVVTAVRIYAYLIRVMSALTRDLNLFCVKKLIRVVKVIKYLSHHSHQLNSHESPVYDHVLA